MVVIFLGVNDVTHGDAVSPEAFKTDLGKLVSGAKQTGPGVIASYSNAERKRRP